MTSQGSAVEVGSFQQEKLLQAHGRMGGLHRSCDCREIGGTYTRGLCKASWFLTIRGETPTRTYGGLYAFRQRYRNYESPSPLSKGRTNDDAAPGEAYRPERR